jgi:hypothetical protein
MMQVYDLAESVSRLLLKRRKGYCCDGVANECSQLEGKLKAFTFDPKFR